MTVLAIRDGGEILLRRAVAADRLGFEVPHEGLKLQLGCGAPSGTRAPADGRRPPDS
jgi:hypothetical protein